MIFLPREDIDSYIIKLKALRGNSFEDEVISLFGTHNVDFQPVVTLPRGDGGSDGLYSKRTISLCCYGLNDVEIHQSKAKKKKAILKKFTSDFMRLLELEVSGKGSKKSYSHSENVALSGVLADGVKLTHLKLVCNWNEDNGLIGDLNKALKDLISKSKCNFVDKNCDCSFIGPKEVVLICSPTLEHYTKLRYPNVFTTLQNLNELVVGEDSPNLSEMDLKFKHLEEKFGNDEHKLRIIEKMRHDIESKWIEDIVFKDEISRLSPNVLSSLDEIKGIVVEELDMDFLDNTEMPLSKIKTCKNKFKEQIKAYFYLWDEKTINKVSEIMVASLIGECPLDWRDSG